MITKYPNDSVSDFYKCTEEIAEVLDKYFGREHGPVSDMSDINTFIEEYANGWGITARSYGAEDLSRETQQEFSEVEEDLEEPWSKAINSMFDIDKDGKVVDDTVVSVTLPDDEVNHGSDPSPVSHYTSKNLKIRSNGQGGLCPERIRSREGERFQLKYTSPCFGNDEVYMSGVLRSVNLEQVLEFMNEAMRVTEDYHHCFVENLCYRETGGAHEGYVHILEIITGS